MRRVTSKHMHLSLLGAWAVYPHFNDQTPTEAVALQPRNDRELQELLLRRIAAAKPAAPVAMHPSGH